jgi:hypothetical protein
LLLSPWATRMAICCSLAVRLFILHLVERLLKHPE